MSRDIDPDKLAPNQPNDHQNIELNEADGRYHEQVYRGDVRRMVAQESAPALTRRIVSFGHVFGHGRLSHGKAQLEQFALYARRAPKHVL